MAAACSAQMMATNPVRSDSHLKNLRRRNNGGMFQCGKCLDWLSLSVSSWSPMLRMRRQRPPKGRPVNKTHLKFALTLFPIAIGCAVVCARTCVASVRSVGARCNAPVRTPQENATRHEARRLRCSRADRFAFCRTLGRLAAQAIRCVTAMGAARSAPRATPTPRICAVTTPSRRPTPRCSGSSRTASPLLGCLALTSSTTMRTCGIWSAMFVLFRIRIARRRRTFRRRSRWSGTTVPGSPHR